MSTGDARELQRELYGAPLGEVGADVMKALGLTQGAPRRGPRGSTPRCSPS